MQTIEGQLRADASTRFGIVLSRFNEVIGKSLLEGAIDTLVRHGASESNVTLVKVPGAFEIPLAASKMAASGKFDGIVCLGAVIRGSTGHYEHVAGQTAAGIAQVALQSGIPVGFGVLTTDTIEQAVERAGSKAGNKGADAALAVLEMINLLKQI
jgi:6,7-dimethyl-8-ribityllumazine synthase